MKLLSYLTAITLLLMVGNCANAQSNLTPQITDTNAAQAQQTQMPARPALEPETHTSQVPVAPASQKTMLLNFRLPEWKKIHAHDAKTAKQTADTLKGLGCEVNQQEHNGHTDINYRCVAWKPLKVDTAGQLDQWQTWLTQKGIDSVVLNPPAKTKLPTVLYRLPAGRTAHIHDSAQAEALEETFNMLGCEVKTGAHAGHIDLTVKCAEWTTIGLTSEDSAHVWQDWLKQNGFETQHTHK